MLNRYNAALPAAQFTEELESLNQALVRRVYLAAVPPELGAPLALGGRMLRRLRVIVMVPGGGPRPHRGERLIGPLPFLESRQHLLERHAEVQEVVTRPVRGEILRDEAGRFYERIGRRIRPIAELAASPEGEPLVIEAGEIPEEERAEDLRGGGEVPAPAAQGRQGARPPAQPQASAGAAPPVRALFAPPGLWRVVAFGEFRPMLSPQLAHPQRLRDSHQIPCYLQLFEAGADVPGQQFLQAALGAHANPGLLQPWSEAWAARLQVSLPAPGAPLPEAPAPAGTVRAGTRFFRLQVAADPTAEPPRGRPPAPAQAAAAPGGCGAPRPWEFTVSREEATYDMQLATAREGWLRRWILKLLPPVSRGELRKWQALLAGKSPAQQLWEVTPPRNGLRDPRVRQWVAEALRLAGDPPMTLDEWEIHWRRKGLH
jgi:hypothetical protein